MNHQEWWKERYVSIWRISLLNVFVCVPTTFVGEAKAIASQGVSNWMKAFLQFAGAQGENIIVV